MHRRRLLALSGALLAGALAGCSAPAPRSMDRSPGPRAEPDVEADTLDSLVADANTFSTALYHETTADSPTENAIVSPLSVTTTLAMAFAGAGGETRSQMREALEYSLNDESLHPAFNALQRELNDRAAEIEDLPSGYEAGDDPVPFELSLVNAVWGQSGFPFEEAYLEVLADHYGGGLREVDYRADPERVRRTINDWVAGQTAGRIDELLPQGTLDTLTRLVLTNAVYFKANWHEPFDPEDTRQAPFRPLQGSPTEVPMMTTTDPAPYAAVDGTQAVELPYLGGDVSMLVLLPPPGEFESVEARLDSVLYSTVAEALEPREGSIAIPKFEFGAGYKLKPALETLGMPEAFDPQAADFSGMADIEGTGERLFIDDVYHDTYIGVDETGTEAAAATGAVIGYTSAPADPFEFVADRPFLFAIRDRPTGAILFLGRVVDAGAAQ
ncbi:MAG: serpin family protein [Halodesulfurarchaeum sp.]|nr:serpin family protein [Halodesulfurarchaeum sp.]